MGSIIKSVILTTSLISTFSVFGQTVTKLVELPESEKMIELLDHDLLIPTGLYQEFSIVAYYIAEDQLITIPLPKDLKACDTLDLNIDLCRIEN